MWEGQERGLHQDCEEVSLLWGQVVSWANLRDWESSANGAQGQHGSKSLEMHYEEYRQKRS